LATEKNVHLFLKAARQLPDYDFYIAGDGPLRPDIEQAARDMANLNYLGWLDRDRIRAVMDTMDMLVLPSTVESFGTIAMEGMVRGRLVLVSAACGILDWPILSRGLFRINRDESPAAAIQRVAGLDEAIRRKKVYLARLAAEQLNDWNIRNWLAVLGCDTGPQPLY
jgi:glycosyltransferase involved in cell wall biosynthesis